MLYSVCVYSVVSFHRYRMFFVYTPDTISDNQCCHTPTKIPGSDWFEKMLHNPMFTSICL